MSRTCTVCPANDKNAGDLDIGHESVKYKVKGNKKNLGTIKSGLLRGLIN
jgi:hypothetical protein